MDRRRRAAGEGSRATGGGAEAHVRGVLPHLRLLRWGFRGVGSGGADTLLGGRVGRLGREGGETTNSVTVLFLFS